MESIKLDYRVGEDGIIHLDIPVDIKNAELEVLITVKDKNPSHKSPTKEWSAEFFEKTAGAWKGKPLTREPQGE